MRRYSYLSRIARVGTESGTSIVPARVLFRPLPPIQVTPIEPRSGGNPAESIHDAMAPSENAVSAGNARADVSIRAQPTFSGHLPITESVPKVTPGGEERPSRHISDPMVGKTPVFPSSAKSALRESAIAQSVPKVTPNEEEQPLQHLSGPVAVERRAYRPSAKPVLRELSSLEPRSTEAREQAPVARLRRHPKAPGSLTKAAAAAFNDDSLDASGPHRPLKHSPSSAPRSTADPSDFPGAPVLQSSSEKSHTILIPPRPIRRETFTDRQGALERHSSDTGTTVHIGALEVRIMAPSAIAPRHPPTLLRQPMASRPQVALSRGFGSFGLTQA
jgi:hypothetical protein